MGLVIVQQVYKTGGEGQNFDDMMPFNWYVTENQESFNFLGKYTNKNISFSQIQQYLNCPYQFYLSRILHLSSVPSPEMIYGSVFHHGIAIFTKQFRKKQAMF